MTIVKPCACNHPGQDSIHGKGMRVHNESTGKDNKSARCTVCGHGRPKKKPAPGVWTSR